jgi:hypothetical protein
MNFPPTITISYTTKQPSPVPSLPYPTLPFPALPYPVSPPGHTSSKPKPKTLVSFNVPCFLDSVLFALNMHISDKHPTMPRGTRPHPVIPGRTPLPFSIMLVLLVLASKLVIPKRTIPPPLFSSKSAAVCLSLGIHGTDGGFDLTSPPYLPRSNLLISHIVPLGLSDSNYALHLGRSTPQDRGQALKNPPSTRPL